MSETTNIRSVCTMATWPLYDELVLLIRSLRALHPDMPLFILTQHKVAQQLAADDLIDKHITITIGMEKFGLSSWRTKSPKDQCHFLAHKALVMKAALMEYPNTLFIDSDILLLTPLPKVDETKDLGLQDILTSYHVCRLDSTHAPLHSINDRIKKFRYTAGWIFVNHNKFPYQYWQTTHEMQDEYGWADQRSLVALTSTFSYFLFPINNHIYTSLFIGRRKWQLRLRQLKTRPVLSYRNKPIGALHFHLLNQPILDIRYIFWVSLLYKSHSPWFDYINNYPGHLHYDVAELRRGSSFLFANTIEKTVYHRKKVDAIQYKQSTYKRTDIRYYLIKIYKYLILPYYLVLETLFFHRIISKSEFAMPKWKLFIITFGWTYRLLGTKYRERLPYPPAKLNKQQE